MAPFNSPRLPSISDPPIGFAHRGARAHAPENTLEAFELALRLGATGLESDAWLTADGEVVLDHDGVVGSLLRGRRRKAIATLDRADLPGHIPTLAELYERCGTEFELSLDMKDPAAAAPTVEVARRAGAAERLWLCHPEVELVAEWRPFGDDINLVNSCRLDRIKEGPERRAATLAELGIEAMNMHFTDWTGGLVTMFHRFDRLAWGWDAQHERMIDELLRMGIDAIFSDHVDRLVDRISAEAG